jgi:hypothetical protein
MCAPLSGCTTKPPRPLCVYCGQQEGTTKDHVIPKCLFLKLPERDTFTVRVCRKCNEDKSRCEDYLADVLQSHFLANQHPVSSELIDRVFRSGDRASSKLIRDIGSVLQPLIEESPNLLSEQKLYQFSVDATLLERALQYIVRGLYAHYNKPHFLSADCSIDVRRLGEQEIVPLLPAMSTDTDWPLYRGG